MDLKQYADREGLNAAGLRSRLAEHGLSVTHEAVRLWLKGRRAVGTKCVPAIVKATAGKVTKEHLRPDVYGPPKRNGKRKAA